MARVPDYNSPQVRQQPIGAPGFSMRAPDASGLVRGIEQAERGFMEHAEQEREKADTAALMNADRQLTEWQNSAMFDPENGVYAKKGANALGITAPTLEAFEQEQQRIGAGLGNDQQRARFEQIVANRRNSFNADLNRYEYRERQNFYEESAKANIETTIQSAELNYNDPSKVDQSRLKVGAIVANIAARNGLSDEATRALHGEYQSELAKRVITMMTPTDRVAALADPQMSGSLMPGVHAAMQREAIQDAESEMRAALAREERAYRLQERRDRQLAEESTKTGDQLLARGELTEDWIEQNRHTLGAAEYRYFYRQLREGGNLNTDPQRYADLRIRVSRGEDVRSEAREYVRSGAMSLPDYDRLVSASEANSPINSVPNAYKRGNDYIRSALRVSDVNPDPAAAQRLASALDDWNEWVSENQQADSSAARQEYTRIAQEYALVDYEQMTLTKRMPSYATVGRSSMGMAQLEEAARATVAAFQAGDISRDEYERQSVLIHEWETALRNRQGSQQ